MKDIGKLLIKRRMHTQRVRLRILNSIFYNVERNCSSKKYQTMKDVKENLKKMLSIDDSNIELKDKVFHSLPKNQNELPVRKMRDSYDSAIVPLKSDKKLKSLYTSFYGKIRLGRIMEEVDTFGVWCCYKHLEYNVDSQSKTFTYIIATLSLDRCDFHDFMPVPDYDIRISGHVCWVGQSTLETIIWVDQDVDGQWKRITKALLVLAARNPKNNGPAVVNRLVGETLEEKTLLQTGEERRNNRLKRKSEDPSKCLPSTEENEIIFKKIIKSSQSTVNFYKPGKLPPKSQWMKDTILTNLVFCHPQHRNLHDKIFGGFLIRLALELSWSTAYLFMMTMPRLINISDIGFYKPVEVGSLMKMYASVIYTEGQYVQIYVYSEAHSNTTKDVLDNTNVFNFTYKLEKDADEVYPMTYLESLKYIDGKRHFLKVMSTTTVKTEREKL